MADSILEAIISRVWKGVDFIEDDGVKRFVKTEKLMDSGDGKRRLKMAVFAAAEEDSDRDFWKDSF
ncbi:hypothetical protein NCCP133_23370 [Cytobacillus sp. NCCP-133]|nr:hypothetical protein NCCP133_23370 [Cytobacillus sp. NCCP-133]